MTTTQIDGGRQIKSATITGDRIVSSTLTDGLLATSYVKADGSRAFTGDQSMGSHKLTNLTDGTSAQDAVTLAQLDARSQGLDSKASVRAATTAAGTLASSFENGDAIDGVTLATGDRILIKNQSTGSENGIYTVNASGAPTRATDADSSAKVTPNLYVFVEEGTTNADTGWTLTNNSTITLGTTALTFTQFTGAGAVTAGAGLTKTSNTLDVVAGDTSLTVNADEVHVTLGDASLEVSSGLRVTHGSSGQVYVANASGVCTPVTMSGDATIAASGALTLVSTVVKEADYVVRETPSGSVNGSNTAYTLANTPVAGTESVFLNGLLQEPGAGNDYTISGATITYLTAPATGDRLRVSYIK
ncbi:hypothetical protein [Nocardia sp. NPDC057030]|uniref:hypothetical protein n=1 Tax=unclassified Nocardia TaxID=2637762 RepID=UPI0036321181